MIGLGAVGSFATEALARSGIGHLRLVDFDQVKPSNVNRQIHALSTTIGAFKVDLVAQRVRDINPQATVEPMREFFCAEKAEEILRGTLDYVVDAIDSVGPKALLLKEAVERKIPVITAMGAAYRMDPGKLRCTDISEVKGCPLCRHVRKKLHQAGIYHGVPTVWSEEAPLPIDIANTTPAEDYYVRGRLRRPLPSMIFVPATAGIAIAHHIITSLLAHDPA